MAATVQPTQIRYNTPYGQQLFDFNTIDSKLYLSRETNRILNVIGNNIVIKGMQMSDPTIINTNTIQVTIGPGLAIQDETLIEFTSDSTVDIDCSSLDDTTTGAHLGVFLDYQFSQTLEASEAKVVIYHIAADGTITNPLGTYNSSTCRILLGVINFTKTGSNVIQASKYEFEKLLVSGSTMCVRGEDSSHINLSNLFDTVFKEYFGYFLKRDLLVSQ